MDYFQLRYFAAAQIGLILQACETPAVKNNGCAGRMPPDGT